MEGRVKLLGHPVHPMLIPFPIGLLSAAVIFDVVRVATDNPFWGEMSYWLIVGGLIGGLAAAVFGAIDLLGIPRHTRAWRIGVMHGAGNVVVVTLFALSLWLRSDAPGNPPALASVMSFLGFALALVTGWLGGELVDRLGVGVDDGAHLDAPSSLGDLPPRAGGASTPHLRPHARPTAR